MFMLFSPEWTEAERVWWNDFRSTPLMALRMEMEVSDDFFDKLRM